VLKLKSGKEIINRVVIPAMASGTANDDGSVSDVTINHYSRLVEAGAGLIIVEYSFIHVSGKSDRNQLGVDNDDKIEGLSKLVKILKSRGALAALQITHCGGKSNLEYTRGELMGPSGVIVPIKDRILEKPREMKIQDILNWKKWFLDAARRAYLAGFDMVEMHSAHGYGINQWISPITNLRTDEWGGSFENRLRLLIEVIQEIRENFPTLLLSVRIPGQDHLDDGLTLSDCIQLAKNLEKVGVDIINVSSGIGGWRRPENRDGEGYLLPEAVEIQKNISLPVIGVGGVRSAEFIDEIVSSSKLPLLAVGRAILENPKKWGEENLSHT
jgi:NADPH2 dehydrogenase